MKTKTTTHTTLKTEGILTPTSQSAQGTTLTGWKTLKKEKPPYYVPVNLYVDDNILYNYCRLSTGDEEYYCSVDNVNAYCIPEKNVIKWCPPAGVIYEKYSPMTTEDLKLFTIKELRNVIKAFKNMKIQYPASEAGINHNRGIEFCMDLLRRRIDGKLKPYMSIRTKRNTSK